MRTTHCTLHIPGHSVHYIQGRQIIDFALRHPEQFQPVSLTDLGAGWFETEIDGETRLGWNHDHDLVTAVARDSVLAGVSYVPTFGALVRWTGSARSIGHSGSGTVVTPSWSGARPCAPVDGVRIFREVGRDVR